MTDHLSFRRIFRREPVPQRVSAQSRTPLEAKSVEPPKTATVTVHAGQAESLSSSERQTLIKNLEFMGIGKDKYPGAQMGVKDPSEMALYFHHGITVKAEQSGAVADLRRVLLTDYQTTNQIKRALNSWSTRNGIGYKFVFYDEILELGEGYKKQNLMAKDTWADIGPNGYIDGILWSQLLKDQIFPIADPHDVFAHLASLTEPTFRNLFKRRTELMVDINRRLEFPSYDAEKDLRNSADLRTKAYMKIADHLGDHVRDSTWENWTYVVFDRNGQPALFTQGNAGFNAMVSGVVKGDRDYFTRTILNLAGAYEEAELPTKEIYSLPLLQEFLKTSSNQSVFNHYVRTLKQHAMDAGAYASVAEKVKRFAEEHPIFGQVPATGGRGYGNEAPRLSSQEAGVIMKDFAKFVTQDPQLKVIFSKKGNEELLGASIGFYQRYKTWIDRSLGASATQAP